MVKFVRAACLTILLSGTAAHGQGTLRGLLRENRVTDVSQFPKELLDAAIDDEKSDGRYVRLSFHVNPSAERLLVLTRDMKFVRALDGWELAALADGRIVYHHNQIHFAPTHSLEISIFDPATLKDVQIYPSKPYQAVRRNFIGRVSKAYTERGEAWFREHNHHMNPELFDSAVVGPVRVDTEGRLLTFTVRFGRSDNPNDPVTFSELVRVTCGLAGPIERIRCREEIDKSLR